jgi:UDP-N-acetylglucosamine:LPS N-acetylglucosamine transferase
VSITKWFFSGILNPGIELFNADPNFLGDKTWLKNLNPQEKQISKISGLRISSLKISNFRSKNTFRCGFAQLQNKFSRKIFHFLYLLAATWVLKTGFGIAIVTFFFFFLLKYDLSSNASRKSIFPTHGTAE